MKMKIKFILLLIVSLVIGCGGGGGSDSSSDDSLSDANFCLSLGVNAKIISGDLCQSNASPIVRIDLTTQDGDTAICTGNIIAPNKVLTAAHCFLTLKIASASIHSDGKDIAVSEVKVHPDVGTDGTNLALFNDVAVLTTARNLNLPAIPIVTSEEVAIGDAIGVQGFGLDENGGFGISKGGAMLVTDLSPNHIFAAFDGNGSNPCNGDSGGPALLTLTDGSVGIVGIVSSGNPSTQCLAGDVTLFTNLQTESVLDFIVSQVPSVGLI